MLSVGMVTTVAVEWTNEAKAASYSVGPFTSFPVYHFWDDVFLKDPMFLIGLDHDSIED